MKRRTTRMVRRCMRKHLKETKKTRKENDLLPENK